MIRERWRIQATAMREIRMEIVAVVTSRLAGCISLGEVSRSAREI
jgi:hypothetical protein